VVCNYCRSTLFYIKLPDINYIVGAQEINLDKTELRLFSSIKPADVEEIISDQNFREDGVKLYCANCNKEVL